MSAPVKWRLQTGRKMVATATDNSVRRYQGYGWRSFLIFSSRMSPRNPSDTWVSPGNSTITNNFFHLPVCAFHLFEKAKNRSVRFLETICAQSLDRGAAGRSAAQLRPQSSAGNAGSSRNVQRFLSSARPVTTAQRRKPFPR